MTEYVILKSEGLGRGDMGSVRGRVRGATTRSGGTEDLSVEVASLDRADALDLAQDPEVGAFAPRIPMRLHKPLDVSAEPTEAADKTWGVEAVGADTSPYDGTGITVAVLDTGIKEDHDAFAGVELVQQDFVGEGDGDADGHGTHCAGTILGRDVGGKRIGVAPGVTRALIGKVIGTNGGSSDAIIRAMQWALDGGASVISMSLGIDFPGLVDRLLEDDWPADLATTIALEDYRANLNLFSSFGEFARMSGPFGRPAVIVAASGNESRRNLHPDYEIAVAPPAAAEDILAVGALGQGSDGFEIASFSNRNVDIAGPGVGVVSAALNGGLVALSGTSMATPHVAGVAALWAQRLSEDVLTSSALRGRLVGSGSYVGVDEAVRTSHAGTGMVQAPQERRR